MFHRILLTSLLIASLPAFADTTPSAKPAPAGVHKYDIDATHTQVTFTWNHFGFSNPSATMEKISGDFEFDAADITKSTISVMLPLDGLHTGVPKLDEHMKSPDMFDAAKFPDVTFKSTKVEKAGADQLKVTGDLTIHGVTKPVTLAVKINKIGDNPMMKAPSAGFDADATIKRSEFGIGYAVPNVSDDVRVHITFDSHLAKS